MAIFDNEILEERKDRFTNTVGDNPPIILVGGGSPSKDDALTQRERKSSNLCLGRSKHFDDWTVLPSEGSRRSLLNGT